VSRAGNIYVLELEQIKKDEFEVRWNGRRVSLGGAAILLIVQPRADNVARAQHIRKK
jgi:hypothetical protein